MSGCYNLNCPNGCCNYYGYCPSYYSYSSGSLYYNCYTYYGSGSDSDDNTKLYIIIGVSAGVALILLILLLIYCCYRRNINKVKQFFKKVIRQDDPGMTILMRSCRPSYLPQPEEGETPTAQNEY